MTPAQSNWFHPAFGLFAIGLLVTAAAWWRYSVRRAIQVLSASTFISLLWLASYSGRPTWHVDFFLISDPLVVLIQTIASRAFVAAGALALLFVVLAILMGRVFCSHVCPMGTLLEITDLAFRKKIKARANHRDYRKTRRLKFVILFLIIGASAFGLNLLGFADPISIVTRSTATIFHPVLMAMGDSAVQAVRPVTHWLDWTSLAYTELHPPSFEGALGALLILVVILGLSTMQARFWCRHVCPLGALLGLLGRFAPFRRRVSSACTGCDKCTRKCPTGAIEPGGKATDRSECIVCLNCVQVCAEDAIKFSFFNEADQLQDTTGPLLTRRGFGVSFVGGLGAGLAFKSDIKHPSTSGRPAFQPNSLLIRPPGATPEPEFLARCIRCGECMKACLTNAIQPDWSLAGIEGLWAPHLKLRHGHCEYSCNTCGQVCPTQAIRPIPLPEKQHARIGTAVVDRHRCLAWAEDRRCLVCDEICPYNAISAVRDDDHSVSMPQVHATRCVGCGTCEEACPVLGDAAIRVHNHSEIRLSTGSYIEEAKARGYHFSGGGGMKDEVFDRPSPHAEPSDTTDDVQDDKKNKKQGPGDKPTSGLPPGIDLDG